MQAHELIADFAGLLTAVKERSTKYRIKEAVKRDKHTVDGWIEGAQPSRDTDVAKIVALALERKIDPSPYQRYTPLYGLGDHLRFEDNVREAPPDLDWLTSAHTPPRAESSEIWGVRFPCSVGVASCPLTANAPWTALLFSLGYGFATFKTRRAVGKKSLDAPQIGIVSGALDLRGYDARRPPKVLVEIRSHNPVRGIPNLVNSIGVPSEDSPAIWQEEFVRARKSGFLGISVLAEGTSLDVMLKELDQVVRLAAEVDPAFIEVNISCPNLKNPADMWRDLDAIDRLVTTAKAAVNASPIPVTFKLPHVAKRALPGVVRSLSKLDGVTFRNTLRVEAVRHRRSDTEEIPAFGERRYGGLSGPGTFPLTLRGVRDLGDAIKAAKVRLPIIAVGGASSPEEVTQLLEAGASVVQSCTAAMFDPLFAWKVRHFTDWVNVESTEDVRPKAELPESDEDKLEWQKLELACETYERKFGKPVSHRLFRAAWADYQSQRPSYTMGLSQRTSAGRSLQQWVRTLIRLEEQNGK